MYFFPSEPINKLWGQQGLNAEPSQHSIIKLKFILTLDDLAVGQGCAE